VIVNLLTAKTLEPPRDAIVIVGSGAAGIALTARLAKAGRAVLLLESGSDVGATPAAHDRDLDLNEGLSLGSPYSGLTNGRDRAFGGTTNLWHGQCMRLRDIDMRTRSWVAESGWPISLADLATYYDEAERWLEITGNGYDRQRWAEHPKLDPLPWNPDLLLHDFTEYAPHPILAGAHRAAIVSDPLVQLVLNATVSSVVVRNALVVGVEVRVPDGPRLTIAARTVILAAGSLENARLLQLSDPAGIGLGDGRLHTGRFLQDHPIVCTAEVISRDYRVIQDRYVALHRGSRRLFPKVRLSSNAQEKFELVDATAVFVHDHQRPALDAARRLLNGVRTHRVPARVGHDLLVAARSPAPVVRDAYRRFGRGLSTGARPSAVWLQLWLEQAPDRNSRISLGPAVDSLGLRRPEVRWRIGHQERETSRQMTRWIGAELERLGVAHLRELAPMHDDDAWLAAMTDAFHPAGTTRMAATSRTGVVDPNLQVHGVHGLFAVGGSVFPTSGYANPTLTIVALALRLGDHLSR
jgi:choline dehydrogenase-like flavoprotein